MTVNNKKTLQEIKEIIIYLQSDRAQENADTKQTWEKRINALLTNDNSQEISLLALEKQLTSLQQISRLVSSKETKAIEFNRNKITEFQE